MRRDVNPRLQTNRVADLSDTVRPSRRLMLIGLLCAVGVCAAFAAAGMVEGRVRPVRVAVQGLRAVTRPRAPHAVRFARPHGRHGNCGPAGGVAVVRRGHTPGRRGETRVERYAPAMGWATPSPIEPPACDRHGVPARGGFDPERMEPGYPLGVNLTDGRPICTSWEGHGRRVQRAAHRQIAVLRDPPRSTYAGRVPGHFTTRATSSTRRGRCASNGSLTRASGCLISSASPLPRARRGDVRMGPGSPRSLRSATPNAGWTAGGTRPDNRPLATISSRARRPPNWSTTCPPRTWADGASRTCSAGRPTNATTVSIVRRHRRLRQHRRPHGLGDRPDPGDPFGRVRLPADHGRVFGRPDLIDWVEPRV